MNLIDKDALVAEIERRMQCYSSEGCEPNVGKWVELISIEHFLNTLEVKEVDLEKLGEIARHLISVKEHVEDMRLYKEEWLTLEKIGYPERFKQKGE